MAGMCESTSRRLATQPDLQRIPSTRVELFQANAFLDASLCKRLECLIEANRRPSALADANGDQYFRTSETCDLDGEDPAVRELDTRLFALNGIDLKYGEPVQGQRYALCQEFKPHTDYFAPDGADFLRYCTKAGQRTWTFMIYVNDVEAGGATRFKKIGKTFQPEVGKLLCWNNRLHDGSVNPDTLHHGMKVRKGTKYVITKWYREREWSC